MTRIEFIRHLHTLTPDAKYGQLLTERFGVEVPAGVPKYQQEFLYKCLLQEQVAGTPKEVLMLKAVTHFDELLERFPWIEKSREEVTLSDVPQKKKVLGSLPRFANYKDGTVLFCARRQKYCIYIGGVMRASSPKLDKLKANTTKRFNITNFIETV